MIAPSSSAHLRRQPERKESEMAAKKTVRRSSSSSRSRTRKPKDLAVKRAAAVKGGVTGNAYRRSQMSDPCDGEE
jgi:hypothetical protein